MLADRAGEALLEVRSGSSEGRELKDAGDRRAQQVVAALLAELRPDDAVLSEEAADSPVRLSADRVWIMDPLDGTREFSERPRPDWAVHVALWQRTSATTGELVEGAVALPAEQTTFGTDRPPVLMLARGSLPVGTRRKAAGLPSRSRMRPSSRKIRASPSLAPSMNSWMMA